jgi:hypothetical protein
VQVFSQKKSGVGVYLAGLFPLHRTLIQFSGAASSPLDASIAVERAFGRRSFTLTSRVVQGGKMTEEMLS